MEEVLPKVNKTVKSLLTNTVPWCINNGIYPEETGCKQLLKDSINSGVLVVDLPLLTFLKSMKSNIIELDSNLVDLQGFEDFDLVLLQDLVNDIRFSGYYHSLEQIHSSQLNDVAGRVVAGLSFNQLLSLSKDLLGFDCLISYSERLGPDVFEGEITWVVNYQDVDQWNLYSDKFTIVNFLPDINSSIIDELMRYLVWKKDVKSRFDNLPLSSKETISILDELKDEKEYIAELLSKAKRKCKIDNFTLLNDLAFRCFDCYLVKAGGIPEDEVSNAHKEKDSRQEESELKKLSSNITK
jgi:hypothetical protein